MAITDDSELDLPERKQLMQRVQKTIHQAPDAVRYEMNGFVIAVGCFVKPLTKLAIETGERNGEM